MIIELDYIQPLTFIVSRYNDDAVVVRTRNPFKAARVVKREATLNQRAAYVRIVIGALQFITLPNAILPKLICGAVFEDARLLLDSAISLLQDTIHAHE